MHFRKAVSLKRLALFCACATLVSLGSVLLAQEAPKVAEIVITGNQNISDAAIRAVIATLKPDGDFTAEAMETDRKAVEALGYFSAVTARSETTPAGVRVLFDVVENPVVKEIRLVGNKSISTERLMSLLRSKVGQVFNEQTLTLDIETIQKEYVEQGFFGYVSEDVGVDPQTGVLTIPITESVVQSIDIVGNKKTPDYIFLREMKTKPGKILNRKTLEEDVRKIYSLGILEVTAYQRPQIEPGTETGKVVVLIPVTEQKTGQVSLGLGYSSRQKVVGRIELSEANFRGKAQKVSLLTEIGSRRPDIVTSGRNSYQVSFYEPWLDKRNTSLNVSGFDKLVYRFSSTFGSGIGGSGTIYSERRKGGTIGLSRPLSSILRLSTNLRVEKVDMTLPDGTNDFLGQIAQPGAISGVGITAARNTRDFDADPAHGWYNSVTAEAGRAKKSTFTGADPDSDPLTQNTVWTLNPATSGTFQKAQIDLRKYMSRGGPKKTPDEKRKTIALRLTGGIVSGKVLFSEQFFVGGAETLRGYREDRFWGNRFMLFSAEYRMPMGKSLTGVFFTDYGDAWEQADQIVLGPSFDEFVQHGSFDPHLGVGIGIRVITPIGPLRLDYGRGSEGGRTHFSIGHAF
ncbi:MAG: POTRA domain-containing protein [Armatimonadota bacterium]|nr:POTRA domain-containing protein [Armatimonadota bacterium]